MSKNKHYLLIRVGLLCLAALAIFFWIYNLHLAKSYYLSAKQTEFHNYNWERRLVAQKKIRLQTEAAGYQEEAKKETELSDAVGRCMRLSVSLDKAGCLEKLKKENMEENIFLSNYIKLDSNF